MRKFFIIAIILVLSTFHISLYADELDFMVLDMRGKKETLQQWEPLSHYLTERLSLKTNIIPIPNVGFARRSTGRDILLTNPVSAVTIEDKGEFEIVLTVNHFEQGDSFAGLIIVHKDSSITKITDLANKKVGVVNLKFAAGGFLFQAYELVKAGLVPDKDFKNFHEMYNQKGIVKRVIQKQIDAGFVRAGLLETLSDEVDVSQIRIINRLDQGLTYPRSTEIYPNWALLVNNNMSKSLKQKIITELQKIPSDSEVAKKGKIEGFVSAADYTRIKKIMSRLNVYHFKN